MRASFSGAVNGLKKHRWSATSMKTGYATVTAYLGRKESSRSLNEGSSDDVNNQLFLSDMKIYYFVSIKNITSFERRCMLAKICVYCATREMISFIVKPIWFEETSVFLIDQSKVHLFNYGVKL